MNVLPPVVARLVADIHGFAGKIGEAEALTKGLSDSSSRNFKQMGMAAMGIGAAMTAVSLGVGAATVRMASDFNTQMERVHTQAGASQTEVDGLKNKVLDLAATTGQGPGKLAEALFHVESVGYRGATAMSVLNEASKLATISGANLDDVTYGLTSVMQTYGAKTQDASKYAAFFNAVVGAGDMRMQDFAKAVGTGYFSAAQSFGVSTQSAGAALAFMTDRGQKADAAATHLRMSLALMAAPSAKAATLLGAIGMKGPEVAARTRAMTDVLRKAGLTTISMADDLKKPDGIFVALSDLKKHLMDSGLSANAAAALMSRSFGGGRSDAAIQAMIQNLGVLHSKYVLVGKGASNYGESWAAAQQQLSVKVDKLKASAEALGIKIGNALIPKVTVLVGWLSKATGWLVKHKGAAEALAGLIVGTLVIGLAMLTAGFIALAAATVEIWFPIVAIIAIIAALAVIVTFLWTHWRQIWNWIKQHTAEAAKWVGDKIKAAWEAVKNWTVGIWNKVLAFLKQWWDVLLIFVLGPIGVLIAVWRRFHKQIESFAVNVWNRILAFFKKWWPLLLVVFSFPLALLLSIWNHFHKQITDTATAVWNAVSGFFKAVWGDIVSAAKTAWSWVERHIVDPLVSAWHWVTRTASSIWHDIVSWFDRVRSSAAAVWNRVRDAVTGPFTQAWHTVTQIGSRIWSAITDAFNRVLSWLSGIGSRFVSVGSDIVSGIINGVSGSAGGLVSKMQGLASDALNAAKSFLGIKSPSRLFRDEVGQHIPTGIAEGVRRHAHKLHRVVRAVAAKAVSSAATGIPPRASYAFGVWVSTRLAQGLLGSVKQVQAAAEKVYQHVSMPIARAMDGEVVALERIAQRRASVLTRLKSAQGQYSTLVRDAANLSAKVRDNLLQGFDITSVVSADDGTTSTGSILGGMARQVAQMQQFAAHIAALKAQGLNGTALGQIINAGPTGGDQTAMALLQGGKSGIAQVNAMQAQLTAAATGVGNAAGSAMYGSGIQAAKGMIAGLEQQNAALLKAGSVIARGMVQQVEKALGMHVAGTASHAVHRPAHKAVVVHATIHHTTHLDGQVVFKSTQKHALQYEKHNGRPAFTGKSK